jgi:hypothetical protein
MKNEPAPNRASHLAKGNLAMRSLAQRNHYSLAQPGAKTIGLSVHGEADDQGEKR